MKKWKAAAIFACLVMIGNCWNPEIPQQEVRPTTLMLMGITHWVLRAPYRPLRFWEVPLMLLSLASCGYGAWTFQPEEPAFRVFFATFCTLALAYAFACTASASGTAWRLQVLEPTRKFSRFSLPFLDFGLVFAPFVFPILAFRYFLLRSPD